MCAPVLSEACALAVPSLTLPQFYVVEYSVYDSPFNEIVSRERLRPPNPNPAATFYRYSLPLPEDVRTM